MPLQTFSHPTPDPAPSSEEELQLDRLIDSLLDLARSEEHTILPAECAASLARRLDELALLRQEAKGLRNVVRELKLSLEEERLLMRLHAQELAFKLYVRL